MGGKQISGLVMLIGIYFFGAVSGRHNLFPWPQLSAMRQHLSGKGAAEESRYLFDEKGRLVADEMKTAVPCPSQTSRTAVLLVLGPCLKVDVASRKVSIRMPCWTKSIVMTTAT